MNSDRSSPPSFSNFIVFVEAWIRVHVVGGQSGEDTVNQLKASFRAFKKQLQPFFPKHELQEQDCLLIALCLMPEIYPVALDEMFIRLLGEGDFPQLGGIRGTQHRGILPTGETALFLLAQDNLQHRQSGVATVLSLSYWLFAEHIIYLEPALKGEPRLSGRLLMHHEYVDLITTGYIHPPAFSFTFPAKVITTQMSWDDLVLTSRTIEQVRDLESWVQHGQYLLTEWGMGKRVKPGYRALFYGPPGTGKTLTAALLGKATGKEVYRVDLSMVVSKYIGETEKNLGQLFDRATSKNWILFFDEADALFGKRTGVRDAHDRYANQEVSYLLQRVEDYDGLTILASNLKQNIDDAFARRFQSMIYFPKPAVGERYQLWNKSFPEEVKMYFSSSLDLSQVARKHELTGSEITNVVHYLCLQLVANGKENRITQGQIEKAIQRELQKSGN